MDSFLLILVVSDPKSIRKNKRNKISSHHTYCEATFVKHCHINDEIKILFYDAVDLCTEKLFPKLPDSVGCLQTFLLVLSPLEQLFSCQSCGRQKRKFC